VADLAPLSGLPALTTLYVSHTQVADLAPLSGLTALTTLDVRGTQVADLAPLSGLTALTTLDVSDTQVADLAPLSRLTVLTTLNVSYTQVADLAPLSRLTVLTTLNVSDTQVADLAPLSRLTALTALNVSYTQMADLAPLSGLTALTTLYVSNTQVADLAPLSGLTALTRLDVSNTQVADLAPLSGLTALTTLDVSRTHVADLAPLLAGIEAGFEVKWSGEYWNGLGIYVKDCPLTSSPPDIVQRGNEAILNYFREKAAGDDQLYEAKMLILGDGGAGKTSLLRRLYHPELPLPEPDETTEGIDIWRHEWTLSNGRRFRLNVWDFGGQQIYHATHHFFLTRRSLYLLVDDTVKSHKNVTDPGFQYWLDRVEVYGGGSPVLIFQNEKGGLSKIIDLPGIQARYPKVMRRYSGDLKRPDSVADLKTGIEHLASTLPHIAEKLPAKWIDIRSEIETRAIQTPYITQKEYFEIYGRHLPPDPTKALFLSQYLHDLGVFLHFQDDPLLSRSVILQNEWATQAVFRILRDKIVIENRGRFGLDDCRRLWSGSAYADIVPELLGLMKRFELCYELQDRHPVTLLAPILLPPSRPQALANWGQPGDLTLRYRYSFLPSGILSRLTVRLHRYVIDPEMAWTTGVLFQKEGTTVLAELLPDGREIELRARGPEARDLQSIVAAELEALNNSIEGLGGKVDARVPCPCRDCAAATMPYYFSKTGLVRRRDHGQTSVQCEVSYLDVDVGQLLGGIPKVDTLPAAASQAGATRKGGAVRIFLASSSELKADRDEFDRYFSRRDKTAFEITRWEDFLDAMPRTRLQDEYNQAARESDIFVSIFATKAGQFTVEEFEAALAQFQATGRPRIYAFIKEVPVVPLAADRDGIRSLWEFHDRLRDLGHYPTAYSSIEDLKLKFSEQIEKLAL
jgi:hypothetical protein